MQNFDLFNVFFNSTSFGGYLIGEEMLLASMIYKCASEEVSNLCEDIEFKYDAEDVSFAEKIEITKKNIEEILRLLKEAGKSRRKFNKIFPSWGPNRKNNYGKLRELAKRINRDRRNINISTITTGSVSALGGAALITSVAFPPAGIALGIGGAVVAGVGGLATFGSSVVEIVLKKKCMNEAQRILKHDEETFKPMGEWFKHSQDLIDLMEKIMGFSVAADIYEGLKAYKNDLKNFWFSENGQIRAPVREFVKGCAYAMARSRSSSDEGMSCLIPILITFFFAAILLRKDNNLIFNSIVLCHRTVLGLMKAFDFGGDVGMLIYNSVKAAGAGVITKTTARLVAHGVFAGIGIALDATNIVFASIDLHKGSISEHAIHLYELADKLEEEYKVLQSVYDDLQAGFDLQKWGPWAKIHLGVPNTH